MSIIGEDIELGLSKQIKVRQEKLGEPIPSTDTIVYNNSKTPWFRVASSVNVSSAAAAGIKDLGTFKGADLAKNMVLFGPAINSKGELPDSVLSNSSALSKQNKSQYNIGGSLNRWDPTRS